MMNNLPTKNKEITDGISDYIENLHTMNDGEFLNTVNQTWEIQDSFLQVPVSEARFLSLLIKLKNPKNILEIGTFRGWSSAWLARSLDSDSRVITIEKDERNISIAIDLWKKLNQKCKIELRQGNALNELDKLKNEKMVFDFVFIDGRKSEYKEYLTMSYDVLSVGGIIVVDNTLHSIELNEGRGGTQRETVMKEFNEFVFKQFGTNACLIPAWDGVTIVYKS